MYCTVVVSYLPHGSFCANGTRLSEFFHFFSSLKHGLTMKIHRAERDLSINCQLFASNWFSFFPWNIERAIWRNWIDGRTWRKQLNIIVRDGSIDLKSNKSKNKKSGRHITYCTWCIVRPDVFSCNCDSLTGHTSELIHTIQLATSQRDKIHCHWAKIHQFRVLMASA